MRHYYRHPEKHRAQLDYNNARAKEERKKNPDKYRDYDRKRKAKNPEHIKAINKKSCRKKRLERFGFTEESWSTLLKSQGGVCGICSGLQLPNKDWCIDHNHKTGRARGLLCNSCNAAIGHLREDQKILEGAMRYLNKYADY